MVFLQRLVSRQPWVAAGLQLPVARVGCWPAAQAASMLVLSSGPPLPAGAPGAGGVMVLGSSAAREGGLVLSFALDTWGDVWLCMLWCRSGSERGQLVPAPA